jgi:hypothetical protein
MRFSINAALSALVSALYLTGAAYADDCTDGPMASLKGYGKKDVGPHGFCHTAWTKALVVTGIEVWATQWQIKGIQLRYSDGTTSILQGLDVGDRHDAITWDAQAPVQEMRLASNDAGDGLGLVYIKVGDKELDVRSIGDNENGENVNIGDGIFLGSSGQTSDFVNLWTPLFLGGTNGKATIVDLQFDESLDEINKKQK